MTVGNWSGVVRGLLKRALRTGAEVCREALFPSLISARSANARVLDVDAAEAASRWARRAASGGMPTSDALMQVLQAQAERIRGSEAKAVGSLQLTALFLAGWIFAADGATMWIKALLVVAMAYLAGSVWSALQVLQPSIRHVLGPTDCSDTLTDVVYAAIAYERNVPIEIRRANLVTAAFLDAMRGAAVIGVAAVGSLLA